MTATGTTSARGIILTGVTYGVAGRTILSDITLTLTEGRIGIIGRNGSGKTTLLRLMAGLIAASEGSIRVEGIDPWRDRKAMLTRLGILFQNPDHQILFPTVLEELSFGLRQMGQSADQAEEAILALLAAEGRAHSAKAATATLSQGQRQYLCLLAVLLMQPETLLLDEPLAGLDLPTQMRLMRRLSALPQRLITITHDPASVAGCDRVIWLESGHIRADGPPGAVLPAFGDEMGRLGQTDADADLAG